MVTLRSGGLLIEEVRQNPVLYNQRPKSIPEQSSRPTPGWKQLLSMVSGAALRALCTSFLPFTIRFVLRKKHISHNGYTPKAMVLPDVKIQEVHLLHGWDACSCELAAAALLPLFHASTNWKHWEGRARDGVPDQMKRCDRR